MTLAKGVVVEYIQASREAVRQQVRLALSVVTGLLVLAVIAAVVAVFQAYRADQEADRANQNEELALEQRDNALRTAVSLAMSLRQRAIPVGLEPTEPLLHHTDLWVSSQGDGTVWRLAADTGEPRGEPVYSGQRPRRPVTDGRYIWVANAIEDTVTRIDPDNMADTKTVQVGLYPYAPVVAGNTIWVVSSKQVTQILPETAEVIREIPLDGDILEPVYAGDALWIMNRAEQVLLRVDTTSGDYVPIPLASTERGEPRPPTVADDTIWLTFHNSPRLYPIKTSGSLIDPPVDLGVNIDRPVFDGEVLWAVAFDDEQILKLDAINGQPTMTIDVGAQVSHIFRETSRLWAFTTENRLVVYLASNGFELNRVVLTGSYAVPVSDGEHLWLSDRQNGVVLMVRLSDATLTRSLNICEQPGQPYFDGANMWIPCQEADAPTLKQVPALVSYYQEGMQTSSTQPRKPVYAAGDLWILQEETGQLVQFDGLRGIAHLPIPVGADPIDPIYDGEHYLWVGAANQLTRIDAANPSDRQMIPLMGTPLALTLVEDALWVTTINTLNDTSGDNLWIIDRVSMTVKKHIDMGWYAGRPVYDPEHGAIWIVAVDFAEGGTVYRFDAERGEPLQSEPIGYGSQAALLAGDNVWFAEILSNDPLGDALNRQVPAKLHRFDRATGAMLSTVEIDELPSEPIYAGNSLWVGQVSLGEITSDSARGLLAINPVTGQITASWTPCTSINQPYFDGRYVWSVCLGFDDNIGTILVIDPVTLETVHTYENLGLGSWPAQKIGCAIWVVHQSTGNASIFNASDGRLLRQIGLGKNPSQPIFDGSHIWFSNAGDGTVQRVFCPECAQLCS
jgi:YVTN family beta-propeller protein